jgi:hypothetical protein
MIIAKELINLLIPPLKPTDPVSKAVTWMEELRTNQLPVVNHGIFEGFVFSNDLLECENLDEAVSTLQYGAVNCYVNESQHFFDILKTASDFSAEVIAVLDDLKMYKGAITVQDTINAFALTSSVQSPGAIIILSMNKADYSLSDISRIIESESIKILSSHISSDLLDSNKIKLTLKLSSSEVSRLSASLERFNYKVIGKYQESPFLDDEQERLDILYKYLNI